MDAAKFVGDVNIAVGVLSRSGIFAVGVSNNPLPPLLLSPMPMPAAFENSKAAALIGVRMPPVCAVHPLLALPPLQHVG